MEWSVEEIFHELELQAPKYGVKPEIARAFFLAENTADGVLKPGRKYRGDAVSPKKARGLFQTLPDTEEALKKQGLLGSDWKYDPKNLNTQVQAGLAALKEMMGRQKRPGDLKELGVMYNAGTEPWQAYLAGNMRGIPAETRQYWDKLTTALGGNGRKPMGAQAIEQAAAAGVAGATQPQQAKGAPSSTSSGSSSRSSSRINVYNNPELFAATMAAGQGVIQAGGSIDTALATLTDLAAQRQAAEAAQISAIQAGGAAIGAATQAEYAVNAKAAQRRATNLMVAGLHPDQINNRFEQATRSINETDLELEPLGQEIDNRMAVGFFDNPLEFIVNQVRLPGMVGQYNAIARKQNRAIQSAKELQSLTATQQSLTTAIDSDEIAAAGVAKAAAEAARAQEVLTKVQQEHAGAAARDAATAAQLAVGKFDTAAKMLAFSKEVQTATEGLSEREAAKVALQMEIDKVNQYLKMIGSNTQHTEASYKLMPAAERQLLWNAAGTGIIAKNFADAATIIEERGNFNKIAQEGDSASINWFQQAMTEAQAQTNKDLTLAEQQAKITGKVVKREEILLGNLNKVQNLLQAQAADMATAAPFNPLKLDVVAAAKNKALENNPVSIFVNKYGPAGTEPVYITPGSLDERKVLERFTAAVAKGQMNTQQAIDAIHEFYTVGSDAQALRTKYVLFGLDKPQGYMVKVPKPSFLAGRDAQVGGTVDLWKRSSIEEYLTKNVAQQIMSQNPGMFGTGRVPGVN